MAITDTLSGSAKVKLDFILARTGDGNMTGSDVLRNEISKAFTDGTGNAQASCWLSATFTATTGAGVTVSLADSADPLGAAGDAVPTADPEGLKLRLIRVINNDTTNFVTISPGTNGITDITGNTVLRANGVWLLVLPNGGTAVSDGVDDEIKFIADTASCSITMDVLYG